MALKHTWTTSIRTDNGGGVADSVAYTANSEANCGDLVAAGAVAEIDLPVDVSQIKSFFVESDQPVTLNTNAATTTSAAQTFTLTAKRALAWNTDQLAVAGVACPLNVDITKLYFDNSAGIADANFKAGFLLDL
jgi:hypothetical protein